MPAAKKEKIAILGSGAGAISALVRADQHYQLAESLRNHVYQMWRLVGQGASGPRPELR